MTYIKIPQNDLDVQKASKHLAAYSAGYISEVEFDMAFLKTALNSGAFYPDALIVERGISKCWHVRAQTPSYVISCCFNLAGLQDKKDPQNKGQWLGCLKEITEKSAMAYTQEGEERTATAYALESLEMVAKDPGVFAANLFGYSQYLDQAAKERFGMAS